MKNFILCKNCNTQNPFYGLICSNCKSYMRERIFNIDLWNILGLLIENPQEAFKKIIFSEHKNFLTFLILLTAGKLLIDSMFISLVTHKTEPFFGKILFDYFVILSWIIILIIIISILFRVVHRLFKYETRIKDNAAVLVYSMAPHVFGLVILYLIELIVFGADLFSNNPSPFSLKEFLAYTLTGFEALLVLWGVFLSIIGIYTQTKSTIYSIIAGLFFNSLLAYGLFVSSSILF